MSHVRLACIARNEAKALPELAECVRPLIDSWVITLDPRTTDDTYNVAYQVFEGIPGEVIYSKLDDETFDFAAARNELMDAAREDGVYLLMLDCDSPCVGTLPDELTAAVYLCDVRDETNDWTWKIPALVRSDAIRGWKMPAHEYIDLTCESDDVANLPDLYVRRQGAGTNDERKRWTIDVLTKEMEAGGEDAGRACYFLANTYHSLGEIEKAVEHYILRIGMPGIDEETFFAMYRAGRLLQPTNVMKSMRAYLDAFGMRPWRSEPLFYLAEIANAIGNHQMALAFANQGLSNAPAANESQFVERWIENWGMRVQWAIASHYLGIPETGEVIDELLATVPEMPGHYRAILKSLRLPNWFAMYADRFFADHLSPFAGKPNLRFLQIGCFTGDASAWLLENVITNASARLDDVDTWEGSEDIHGIDFTQVEQRYDEQTAPHGQRVSKHRMASGDFFASQPRELVYDFIYIDGDHTAAGTLHDAIDAYDRLKVGGVLAFDDYTWRGDDRPLHCPYPAIDAFMALYADRFEVIETGAQVWLKRTA